jgi:hypothetical protein
LALLLPLFVPFVSQVTPYALAGVAEMASSSAALSDATVRKIGLLMVRLPPMTGCPCVNRSARTRPTTLWIAVASSLQRRTTTG